MVNVPVNRAEGGIVKVPEKLIWPVRMSVELEPMVTRVLSGPGNANENQESDKGTPTIPNPTMLGPSGAAEKAERLPAVRLRPSLVAPAYAFPVTVTLLAPAAMAVPIRRQRRETFNRRRRELAGTWHLLNNERARPGSFKE